MGSEIYRERVLANFRPDRFARNAGPAPWNTRRELREGNSNAHLYLIRQLWCTLGHERGVDCHHLQSGPARQKRGLGLKSPDMWAIPLAHAKHMDLHALGSRHERDFFEAEGVNPYALAAALWANTGDISRMARVLTAHQLEASKRRFK